jgi:hypothetical protein
MIKLPGAWGSSPGSFAMLAVIRRASLVICRRVMPAQSKQKRLHKGVFGEQADFTCYWTTFSGFTQVSHPIGSIASMSASIRDRLIALALYRMVSAPPEADEAHPQSHSNANAIRLLERLYRLRLVSAGILWRGG